MTERVLNVLVAEPDALASEIMAEVIRSEGHKCTVVTSSDEAYLALSKPFDVLFLHRGIDKINVERIARYARGISYIPIIILVSSQAPKVAEADRLKIDADAVIFKPLDISDITHVLNLSNKNSKNFNDNGESPNILIVTENKQVVSDIRSVISTFKIDAVESRNDALKIIGETRYDIIISDALVGRDDGVQLIQSAKNINPFLWSIIISEDMNVDIAVAALKEGVNDIIERPIKSSGVIQAIEKARHTIKLEGDKRRLLFDLQSKTKNLEEANLKLNESESLISNLHKQTLLQLDELSKFKKIIEFSGDAIYVIDADSFLFTSANSRASQMLGYTNEEFLKLGPKDIDPTYPIQTEAEIKTLIETLISLEKPLVIDTHNICKDGRKIPVEISVILQEIDNKRYILAIVRDISERNEKEKELKKLSHVVEQNPISVLITNLKGVIEYANPSFYSTFGLDVAEVMNKPADLLFNKMNYLNTYEDIWSKVFEGNVWRGQVVCINKQNRKIWLNVVISPVKNEFNEIANFVILQEDVSHKVLDAERQKEQEKHMMESSRLATLGTLVAGIGHEINNPNNFIMMNSATLKKMWEMLEPSLLNEIKEKGSSNSGGRDFKMIIDKFPLLLSDISSGSERIKNIVSELRNFARKDDFDYNQSVNINEVVMSACKIINSVIVSSTSFFNLTKEDFIPTIRGNAQRLEQVFICFIQNSCQALPNNNKRIDVTLGFCTKSKRVKVVIKDEGIGIPKEILNKIFDPFFTTKRNSGGTGMGLSVSKSIIEKHNGEVQVESAVNIGTTITVFLPSNQ